MASELTCPRPDLLPLLPGPKSLWHYFMLICETPHGSFNCGPLSNRIVEIAKEFGLEYEQDESLNVVVRKPASSPALEKIPMLCFQAHIDMVCQSDANVDFKSAGIKPKLEGNDLRGYIDDMATTLGADNGLGAAAMMAMMSDKFEHGPLEFLFTTDEEVGLIGAAAIKPGFFKSKTIINLDEEDLSICVGCCGGFQIDATLDIQRAAVDYEAAHLQVEVKGLFGGHSGADIEKQRANAIKLLGRLLAEARLRIPEAGLLVNSFNVRAGAHNAIPRQSLAQITLKKSHVEPVKELFMTIRDQMKVEFTGIEPDVIVELSEVVPTCQPLDESSTARLLRGIILAPSGVVRFDPVFKNLVESSSTNTVLTLNSDENKAVFLISSRSSSGSQLEYLKMYVKEFATANGMTATPPSSAYPPWVPKYDAPIVKLTIEAYKEAIKTEPTVYVVHGGLETSLLSNMGDNIECVAIGPMIRSPHTPQEALEIDSVVPFWDLTMTLINKWNTTYQ
ncbi:hypothetical protein GEMRC1_007080 [Eukaryota sp. GEM-RC1]